MPKVVREDIDNLNASVTITIEETDYKPRFDEELKKYREKAHIKGFRPGKAPLSFIKKSVGQPILGDVVNGLLQQELITFLQENEGAFLGQPIPSEDQEQIDFNVKNLGTFQFKFDLGIAPEFEIEGLDKKNKFDKYAVQIPDKTIEEEIELNRKRHGERTTTEEQVEEGDIVQFHAVELDGKKPKEDGWETTFSILVERIDDSKTKKALLKSKKGDKLSFNIFKLEKKADEQYTKKYLLNMDEEQAASVEVGEMFEGTIEEVTRIEPAEVDQAFFDKVYGEGKVSTIEEARELMREEIGKHYERQAEGILFRDFQNDLLEKNRKNLPLPDGFMKRWLEYSDERNTKEMVERDYENFAESLRWSLIRGKMVNQFDLKVTEAEIREGFAERIKGYMGQFGDNEALIQGTIERLMQDQKQVESVAEEIAADKLFEHLKETMTVKDKKITVEKFEKVVEEIRKENEAKQHQHHDHDHDHDHEH